MNDRLSQVQEVLDRLRPAMRADGGDVQLISVEGGTLNVKLCGACIACPSSKLTLKLGIEKTLKQHLPWVDQVVRVG